MGLIVAGGRCWLSTVGSRSVRIGREVIENAASGRADISDGPVVAYGAR